MPQPRAAITQKDLERAIKAAKRQGCEVEIVAPDGTKLRFCKKAAEKPVEEAPEITKGTSSSDSRMT